MRRRSLGCAVVVCAAWLAAASALARAETVIPWQAARAYEGDVVTVEGDVARARLEADTCILEFAPDDEKAFRVVLLIPLLSDLPRQPQRLYEGKRVRATGKVRTWRGRPEMIVHGPDAIEVVALAAPSPEGSTAPAPQPAPPTTAAPRALPPPTTLPTPTTRPTPATLPPATTPAATPSPSTTPTLPPATTQPSTPLATPPTTLPPSTLPAPPSTVRPPSPAAPVPRAAPEPEQEEAPHLPRRVDPCDAARERWRRAAGVADARATELARCLRAGGYRCRPAAAAIAPALSELEWAEQQVEAACP